MASFIDYTKSQLREATKCRRGYLKPLPLVLLLIIALILVAIKDLLVDIRNLTLERVSDDTPDEHEFQ